MKIVKRRSLGASLLAFTLIELLVVISIMAVLAGLTIPVMKSLKRQQVLKVARAEMVVIESALDNYKARYGTYPPGNKADSLRSQLYYELSGVTHDKAAKTFTTLDGAAFISESDYYAAYHVGGVINSFAKGSDEDTAKAKNFLPNLKQNQTAVVTNDSWNNKVYPTTALITAVGGPDDKYQPFQKVGLNPFRYVSPGVNNPGSYDLWVQLVISGKTNLLCNWNKQPIINSPLP